MFLAVIGRLFIVQIVDGNNLQKKALDQWTREIPIIASRGVITDSNGITLVDNADTYSIFVRKNAVKNLVDVSNVLAKVLNLEYENVYNRIKNTSSSEVTVKKQVSKESIAKLVDYNLEGVYFSRDNTRVYKYGNFLTQILGFTSNDGVGQSGLELYYDKYMQGIDGEILYETDIVGNEIGNTPTYISGISGLNVKLTIDSEIQLICESVMERAITEHSAKRAEVVIVEPNSGEIKAMCIKPSFDLNNFDRNDLTSLYSLSRNTLISDVYEPGSTFKIITSAINVEEYYNNNKNAFSLTHVFNSSKYRYVDGQRVKCWSSHLNGNHIGLNLSGALNNSCNPIFVDIALSLGKNVMYEYFNKFNFASTTGIDFNGESQGMILPVSSVKNVDLARIGFGQTIAVTPLQLLMATASIINGGYYYKPYLVSEIYSNDNKIVKLFNSTLKTRTISEKTSKTINKMLEDVVSVGSGKKAYIEGYRVAGKTGDILTTCVNLVKNLIKIYT